MTSTAPALLVATTNPDKLREIRRALDGLAIRILTLDDVPAMDAPEETGDTFAKNALIKAKAYATATGLPTVAEDSGLVIDAIGGRPGVESARYPGATYPEKFANLYRELAGQPQPWAARFVCSVALVDDQRVFSDEGRFACEGTVEGRIATSARGANGFGYDPIFFYPPYGCTLGEAAPVDKLAVSHRGLAFRRFRRWLGP